MAVQRKEFEIGLKFSGRTDSRGARFLHGAPGTRSTRSASASIVALIVAALCGVSLPLVAALRHFLGTPEAVDFAPILFTPVIVAARFAGEVAPETGWVLGAGVLVLAGLCHVAAPFLKRRPPDAILWALLAFELFWLVSWINSLLPPANAPSWSALTVAQQINLSAGVLLLLALLAAWLLRPASAASFDRSAPSRITSFLKKRRTRSRIAGAVLMALAIVAICSVALAAFGGESTPGEVPPLAPQIALWVFLLADAIYLGGRKLWRRLS